MATGDKERDERSAKALGELEDYGLEPGAPLEELAAEVQEGEREPACASSPTPSPAYPAHAPVPCAPAPEFLRWKPFLVYLAILPLPLHVAAGVYFGLQAAKGTDVFVTDLYRGYLIAVAASLAGLVVPVIVAHRSVGRVLPKGQRKGTLVGALMRALITFTLNVLLTGGTVYVIDRLWRMNMKG